MRKIILITMAAIFAVCVMAQQKMRVWKNHALVYEEDVTQIDSITFYDEFEGALSGEFSVSSTKKVRFSKGNLQYQASTSTWRFADNQYDIYGIYGEEAENVPSTHDGWIDMFGWGTGNNPTLNSTDNNDYLNFVDWGINPISNGGNVRDLWRTLSKEEWNYLFRSRPNASSLFGFGNVNGVNGIILLPDNWEVPLGLSFVSSEEQGVIYADNRYFSYNNISIFTSKNIYTEDEWQTMEAHGAIIFPATHLTTYDIKTKGNYWSSSSDENNSAYNFWFDYDGLDPLDNNAEDNLRYAKNAVRLVRDVK